MFLFRMAMRNLLRQKRRTTLSMISVVAGVWVMITGRSFINGFRENIIRAQEDTFSAHVLMRPADYPTSGFSHPVDDLFTVDESLADWLDGHTTAWTSRVLFSPTLIVGGDGIRVRAVAVEPEEDPVVFPRDTWKTQGVIPESAADGVMVSKGLAALLDLGQGAVVTLRARTAAGSINATRVQVSGVFSAGNPVLDRAGILVTRDFARDFLRSGDGVSHLAVRLPNRRRAEAFAPQLREHAGSGVEVVTWFDECKDLLALQEIRQKALNILVFVLMGMSAAGIANTILMAAYERIREIGTMRAMGMTRRMVLSLFLVEGALLGAIGGTLGAGIAGAMIGRWSRSGIDLTALLEKQDVGDLPVSAMLYVEFSWPMLGLSVLFAIVVAALASVYPARVASRMVPAEAVRAQ